VKDFGQLVGREMFLTSTDTCGWGDFPKYTPGPPRGQSERAGAGAARYGRTATRSRVWSTTRQSMAYTE
jgi:hypothetical protein